MESVFILQHSYELNGCEETKFIGVYSSGKEAMAAIERLKLQPGFNRRPKGFYIEEYKLNEDHWTEGYSTMTIIQAKDKKGQWVSITATEVKDDLYEVVEPNAEDFLEDLKNGDFARCESRSGILYVIEKIIR